MAEASSAPGDAHLEEARDVLAVLVLREHDDLRARAELADLERGLEAAEIRHRDVEEDDVGLQLLAAVDGLPAVLGLAHDLDVVGLLEEGPHALAHEGVVIGDDDARPSHERPPPESGSRT